MEVQIPKESELERANSERVEGIEMEDWSPDLVSPSSLSVSEMDAMSRERAMSYSSQILSRNTELPHIDALDAGDVVECYTLTRMAKLANVNTRGSATISVRKSAIGFRYKPKSSSPDAVTKEPFALTLEYGPQRTGATPVYEAMPSVNGHKRDLEFQNGDGMYVSWENHAKIYYSLSIPEDEWDNAYYMAPITGAVLTNILNNYIVDYPTRHPRYQPLAVVEKDTGAVVLKSSNSEDFVWDVFQKLADMYVAIDPILAPKRYALNLYVDNFVTDLIQLDSSDVDEIQMGAGAGARMGDNAKNKNDNTDQESEEKGQTTSTSIGERNVANAAAEFYEKLFSCVEAIKTGDYSAFERTSAPSPPPSIVATSEPTKSPTDPPTASKAEKEHSTHKHHAHKDKKAEGDDKKEDDNDDDAEAEAEADDDGDNETGDDSEGKDDKGDRRRLEQDMFDIVQDELEKHDEEIDEPEEEEDKSTLPFVDGANEAAEEAEKAAEKAKEAAVSHEDHKAAEAAGQAAEAAKKAAQATSEAAAQAAMESILGGDGTMMTNVISTCFSDPRYGIFQPTGEDEETGKLIGTSTAYVYLDGSNYYRVNLTSPFVKVEFMDQHLPIPNYLPNGKGDVIDIALAMSIIGGFLFGIIVMLHHIRVLDWDYRLQFKWFFHPRQEILKRGGYSSSPLAPTPDDLSLEDTSDDVEMAGRNRNLDR